MTLKVYSFVIYLKSKNRWPFTMILLGLLKSQATIYLPLIYLFRKQKRQRLLFALRDLSEWHSTHKYDNVFIRQYNTVWSLTHVVCQVSIVELCAMCDLWFMLLNVRWIIQQFIVLHFSFLSAILYYVINCCLHCYFSAFVLAFVIKFKHLNKNGIVVTILLINECSYSVTYEYISIF